MNSLRERFIEDTRRSTDARRDSCGLDFRTSSQKGQEGRFLNKHTHAMWLGYQLAHTAAFYDDKVENEESVLMGRYVVMNRVGPGVKVKSSHHPFVHRGRKTALDEAERLTLEHNSEFVVFRCVAARAPKTITEVTTNA
jgi:hypothetical protein